jgi:predicted N-acetyltransferase YhbS
MRVSMLCENGKYSGDFQESLYKNTVEFLRKGLRDESVCLWVAVDGNIIIAMCCINYFYLPPNELCLSGKSANLGNMYVLPGFRKKGIAGKLLGLIVIEAKNNSCERIVLVPTEMGKPLYEKFGFTSWFDAMVFFPMK